MSIKTTFAAATVVGILAAAVPLAYAQTTTGTTNTATIKITCVGTAVAAREAALGTAVAAAYNQTTVKDVGTATRAAWKGFNTAMKNAQNAWKTAQNAAWKAYRTAAVACKAPSGTGDGINSSSEMSGR